MNNGTCERGGCICCKSSRRNASKKSDLPYILHPMEAAVVVGTMTDDQNVIAAAALHDVVEDAGVTIEEIEEKFGKRVRELVASETEDKRADLPPSDTWRIRKEES